MRLTRDPSDPIPNPRPSPHTVAILRRCAASYIFVTQTTDDKDKPVTRYCYADGTVVRDHKNFPVRANSISRMVGEGWLMPLNGEEGPPQRYRARTVADGLLPRFHKAG